MLNQLQAFESYRDPGGKVILGDDKVWRLVRVDHAAQLEEFLGLNVVDQWRRERRIIDTEHASTEEIKNVAAHVNGSAGFEYTLFKHTRVNFPSFPYEWSPAMLYDAGKLTLSLAGDLLAAGWGLKDATPFNILFEGPNPVFVDILSFEKRNAKDPIWLPYNQFVHTFLTPLLANKELGIPLQKTFTTNRDGLPTTEAANLFGWLKRAKPNVFSVVTLPELLSRRAMDNGSLYKPKELASAEMAQFVFARSFRRLDKQLEKVASKGARESTWTGYTEFNDETIPDYMRAKRDFVTDALKSVRPRSVLDVGCNTGTFSFQAARSGADVIAVDHDEAVIDRVYRTARQENLNVLPLVVNLSRPTPRLGWRYSENPSFLDRALGHFDLALMLAVVHHILVQERIPLREIFRLAADLTTDALVVEYVPPDDKMFRSLTRGRDHLHSDLTAESFVETAREFFEIVRSHDLPETKRIIYLMRKVR